MKAMVIGNQPHDMADFGHQLGELYGVPTVLQLPHIAKYWGIPAQDCLFGAMIDDMTLRPNWIAVGNSFDVEPENRVIQADIVYCFDADPFRVVSDHFSRWYKDLDRQPLGMRDRRADIGLNVAQLIRGYIGYDEQLQVDDALLLAVNHDTEIRMFRRAADARMHLDMSRMFLQK